MKKLLLTLSALALAAVPAAADTLEAGTADSPKYYTISAAVGNYRYLSYDPTGLTLTSNVDGVDVQCTTHLVRNAAMSLNSVWEVTAGTATGTFVIKNLMGDAYLMDFMTKGGEPSTVDGCIATTSATPVNIYGHDNGNGTYMPSINNNNGYASIDGVWHWYGLRAPEGDANARYCINSWSGNGVNWTFAEFDFDAFRTQAASPLQAYIENVPADVAAILNKGIADIKALTLTTEFETQAAAIRTKAIADANSQLATGLNGKTYSLNNLRRAASDVMSYLAVNTSGNNFLAAPTIADAKTYFTFKSTENGGYTLYNANTQTYISNELKPVSDEASAKIVYPVLNSYSDYNGVAFPYAENKTGNGFNQNTNGGALTNYTIDDGGSIWALVAYDVRRATAEILTQYIPNVPAEVGAIFQNAIAEVKALEYSETVAAQADAIHTKALADANALLATGLNGANLSLKNLRQNKFISVADGEWVYSVDSNVAETTYTFNAQADGGYIAYNEAAKAYFGPVEQGEGETFVSVATEESESQVVYPVIMANGNYYGVALALEANPTGATTSLNTNNNAKILHTYRANDGGSIFAIVAAKVTAESALNDAKNSVISVLEPYIPNVPTAIGAILQTAIDEAKTLEYFSTVASKAAEIRDNAIAAGNAELSTGLNGKTYVVRNLRRASQNKTSYLSMNTESGKVSPISDYKVADAWFTLTSTENGGYTFYNDNTKTYINASYALVGDEASAKTVYPVLNSNSGFSGVAFPFAEDKTGNGFNEDNGDGYLVSWSINDGGSIFAIEDVKRLAANVVTSALEPYIPNIPAEVSAILQSAIAEANNLEVNAEIFWQAEVINTKALADANEELKSCFNGKYINMKSLNSDQYVASVGNAFGVGEPAAAFKFVSTENGGYTIYSPEKKVYFGKNGQSTTYVADAASAQSYYPQLSATSVGSAICFPSSTNFPTDNAGLCLNTGWGNYFYDFQITSGNNIFGVFAVEYVDYEKEVIEAAINNVTSALTPYIPNLPDVAADIFTAAIEEAENLEYSDDILAKAQAITTKAMADGNAMLATGLAGKTYNLKNLRQDKFISVADGEWVYSLENNVAETNFTFNAQTASRAGEGYIVYNQAAKVYFGPIEQGERETYVSVATDEAESLVVYPFIMANGNYYGVALALEANPTGATTSLNTNNNAKILHTYRANDGGSIFALTAPDPSTAIEEVEAADSKVEGIYDLMGRRVSENAKGLLIINGKKVYRL